MITNNNSYTGTPNAVDPASGQNALNTLFNANAPGSDYSALYGGNETIHLKQAIYETIVENFPAQYNIFRILFSKPIKYFPSDEFTWTEENWYRPVLTVATVSSGGVAATHTLILTAGGTKNCALNDSVWYPDGTQGIISSVNTATNTIIVSAPTGTTLPVVTAGDKLNVGFPVTADGQNFSSHFDQIVTTKHTNYICSGERNRRWSSRTLLKYKNNGTTDYIAKDMKLTMNNAQLDVFQQFFNGTKGNVTVTVPAGTGLTGGTYNAKISWGIYPFMKASGSQHATATPSTLEATFRQLAFNTNYKNVNVPRFILGTDKALSTMSYMFKEPIRYFPEHMTYDMGLEVYKVGTMKFVPMPTPLFEQRSNLFPAFFENMLLVLDLDTIDPTSMTGLQPFEVGDNSNLQKGNGGNQDWLDAYVRYNIGLMMTNTDSSFWINLTGI